MVGWVFIDSPAVSDHMPRAAKLAEETEAKWKCRPYVRGQADPGFELVGINWTENQGCHANSLEKHPETMIFINHSVCQIK